RLISIPTGRMVGKAAKETMPISVTGNKTQQSGLTLVEILVALAIVGLLAGVVVLTLPAEKSATRQQAFELGRQMQAAYELSVTKGQLVALEVTETGYDFQLYDRDGWRALTVPGSSRKQFIPDRETLFELSSVNLLKPGTAGDNSRSASLFTEQSEQEASVVLPDIVWQPTGEVMPAEITLTGPEETWVVVQSATGEINVRQIND
ncbi:MAG: prepilin-type N-terminal cleavage/methylation domain-containing protein, partial [Aquisalinus sp.]|nr:prepilin-type N-terminal cleavage/methylation domain-containing protein [Aquisalinus sp.]